jgi:hypothetical protein
MPASQARRDASHPAPLRASPHIHVQSFELFALTPTRLRDFQPRRFKSAATSCSKQEGASCECDQKLLVVKKAADQAKRLNGGDVSVTGNRLCTELSTGMGDGSCAVLSLAQANKERPCWAFRWTAKLIKLGGGEQRPGLRHNDRVNDVDNAIRCGDISPADMRSINLQVPIHHCRQRTTLNGHHLA